jgi:tryptophan 2,3-dioxygenase
MTELPKAVDADEPDLTYAGRTPYVAYTDADVLAGLIHPVTDEPLEVTFVVSTQIMEMHFNLLRHEWLRVIERLSADDLAEASTGLQRSTVVQDSLNRSWDLLAVMSPVQYNRFRRALGKASGFQSFSYRSCEFLLGAKNQHMLNPHSGMPEVSGMLRSEYESPSLYEAALAFLARRGLPVPRSALDWDPRQSRTVPDPTLVELWRRIYAAEDELTELADRLTAVAERHAIWRFVHYTAVRRILGAKPGTGGSAGLAWLKRAVDEPVFIDLWEVRTVL